MLAVGSPAVGMASAHGHSTESGDAVGRPGLDNPAPGLRAVQAIGDRVYNQNTPLNRALDNSLFGVYYHQRFGTPNYADPTHGDNGNFPTLLNSNVFGGVPRFAYDLAQELGTPLPNEEDLPGTAIRALSGVPKSAHPDHPHPHSTVTLSNDCNKVIARTSLRAQGSC
ncbi:hypothetical protein MELE44368_18700 [Mycolicibacterium elephantis DSM 44368]|uniref:Uncharacterized protein n=2 Tax=Mycolicibacterium elephantis TaxID=81858 RepID=A0A439DUQ1_9MYCO|nr:hypothetical protein MELE44368_18700 [Mycolicibacterium elephantis DSM 44368]